MTGNATPEPADGTTGKIGRRSLFAGIGAAAVTGAAGFALGRMGAGTTATPDPATSTTTTTAEQPALPAEHRLAGATWPEVPPRHLTVVVLTLASTSPADARAAIDAIRAATSDVEADAGELTVLVGVAPALAATLWPGRVAHPDPLPAFRNDRAPFLAEGDVLVEICAETAAAVADRTRAILAAVPGATLVWRNNGSRDAPTPAGTTRTPIGFVDGIINPRTVEMLEAGVWVGNGRDTYAVVRRMHIEPAFTDLPVPQQEEAIGRRRDTGAPLSGGDGMAEVDLFAKSETGRLLTPTAAHARRAHPSNIGRPLMLRRSYPLGDVPGAGLLFLAFFNDPATFIMTQRRLDEQDGLISHTYTDAGGVFFIPDPDIA